MIAYTRKQIEENAVDQETPVSCFRACVATILGLKWKDVPNCCDGDAWDFDAFQVWLGREHQLQAIEVLLDGQPRLYPVKRGVICILTGESPRPCTTGQHAVVCEFVGFEGFEVIHDPHESRKGIVGEPKIVTFFVPIAGYA